MPVPPPIFIPPAGGALAAAQAAQRQAEQCRVIVEQYVPIGATRQDMQEYAKCVLYLFPTQGHVPLIIANAKLTLFLLVASVIVGALVGWRKGYDGSDPIMGALVGPLAVTLIILFIEAVYSLII